MWGASITQFDGVPIADFPEGVSKWKACRHELLSMRCADGIYGIINVRTKSVQIATFTSFKIKVTTLFVS